MEKFKLSNSSKERRDTLRYPVRMLINRVISKSPHDFGIPQYGGRRTTEEQEFLYSIGRTIQLDRDPVTWLDGVKKKSIHQLAMAFDIYIYDEHGACWDCLDKYEQVANLIKSEFKQMQKEGHFCGCEKLTWGGDWKKKDYPHFQITKK